MWQRQRDGHEVRGLVHHSDRGVQYLSVRYTDRLDAAGALRSVGSKGDSYDNAAAESLIGLYKTELIRRRGPWRGLGDVELATLEYVDWFNTVACTAPAATSRPPSAETSTTVRSPASPKDQPAEPNLH
ncbi:MAG: Mobile element protein [uncultured Blastococcus sp.]|uniref:Mobile element protein n=1 Tax=uncultured Blastococcus sp. TaxID=217144 RepID=A0A6J4JH00_9ACTN|nr:MAG: Mobile element protein [uncultured Blastococcus sp.]